MRAGLTLALLLPLLLAACGKPAPWRQEAYVFGTRVELLIVTAAELPEARARRAGDAVLREFDRLHRLYHAWRPSELSALNEGIAAGRPTAVSAELAAFIGEAQRLSAAGDHLFDPGIGRLIALWGFQSDDLPARLPDPAAQRALLAQHASIADLTLTPGPCPPVPRGGPSAAPATAAPAAADGGTAACVVSRNPGVALDFGGYLKGVALDRAAALLRREGVANALVNIGGNIMALGSKHGTPWRVGIQHPRPAKAGGGPLASVELRDGEAIGTSGDYHRYFELAGRRYCHLLDPRSGAPASGTQAVTVLIPPGPAAGMRSDALSKPIFIAGDDWRAMARRLGVAQVLKVGADGTAYLTPPMRARLTFEAADTVLQVVE